METLLKNDFTAHYNLPVATIADIYKTTNLEYFEIADNQEGEIIVTNDNESGVACFKNPSSQYHIAIINYEKFFNSLKPKFEQGKKRCDAIIYTSENKHFLLSELTDTDSKYLNDFVQQETGYKRVGKVNHAKRQLRETLELLKAIESIKLYIEKFANKRCCFFSKYAHAPTILNATEAFNRLPIKVLKMPDSEIESLGFEYFEYLGKSIYEL